MHEQPLEEEDVDELPLDEELLLEEGIQVIKEALHVVVLGKQQVPNPFKQVTISGEGHVQFGSPDEQKTPLDEELEDEEELDEDELLDEGHSIKSGEQKSGAPSTQQVGDPLVHDTNRPARLQKGVRPFAHRQPEEELLEDEVVEEPLLDDEEEVVEEPLLEDELDEEVEVEQIML